MCDKIFVDIFRGLTTSLRLYSVLEKIYTDQKLINIWNKIIKFNLIWYILPNIICDLIGLDMFYYISWVILLPSMFLHIIWYVELIMILSGSIIVPNSKGISRMDSMVTTIIMFVYQIMIYGSISIINILFSDRISYLKYLVNFFILCTYHSCYAYNNLWQHKQIDISHRLNIHERKWPYFFGYGTIISIVYMYANISYFIAFYNIYLSLLLCIPFLSKFDNSATNYVRINLSIFPRIMNWVRVVSKYLIMNYKPDQSISIAK